MVLSAPKCTFGVHSITAYNPDTLLPYGTAKVVGSANFNNSGEIVDLFGGSNRYPWKKEAGVIDASGSFTFKEIPDWSFEAFLGKAATVVAAQALGSATALTNRGGTTVVAATGIATATVLAASETDLKTDTYIVVAASATTVDVFAMSDVDAGVGTARPFIDDALKITASPLTIATGATVEIPFTGIELTGGAGTIAMVTGDTASFSSKAINDGSTDVVIGSDTDQFIDVGLYLTGQRQKDGTVNFIDIYRGLGIGMPFNFAEKAFFEGEVPWGAQFDTVRNGVFSYGSVIDTN